MKQRLKVIEAEVLPILKEGNHFAKIEAARILAALSGIYIGSAMRSVDPPQAEYQLRAAQETLAGRVFQRAAARKRANHLYYVRTRIRELQADGSDPAKLAAFQAELSELDRRGKVPRNRSELTVEASEHAGRPATLTDGDSSKAELAEMVQWAQSYLKTEEAHG